MNGLKVFKKGDVIFKEGDKVTSILVIQSGSVLLQFLRGKQKIEFFQASPHMVLGEYSLSGQAAHPATAIANTETKMIEIPIDGLKAQIESGPQLNKALFKGLLDKLKHMTSDLRRTRLERDSSPCPPDQTAKIFAAIFHTANHKGEKKPDRVTIAFSLLKGYAQKVFLEGPKRLEQALNILVKLKWAELEMVKSEEDPDGPEEIGDVHFLDLPGIEEFVEYFQYYHYKPGKGELLKVNDNAMMFVFALLEQAREQNAEPDRFGICRLDYTKVIEGIQKNWGFQVKGSHFDLIESKGLLTKRQSTDMGVQLQFEIKEFTRVFKVWGVLREIAKWNEKGIVEMNDVWKPVKRVIHDGPVCPECQAPVQKDHKFCASCGHKLKADAA